MTLRNEKKKSFWALISTQFFGAFNDNFFKIAVALLVTKWVSDDVVRNNWISVSNLLFVAPFLAFSLLAGRITDRVSKATVIVSTKIFELVVIVVSLTGLYLKSIPIMMTGLGLLALQSTFFAPAKYGILPELLPERDLSNANGILNIFTIIAILAGTVAGSFVIGDMKLMGFLMGGISLCGFLSSLFINKVPAAKPNQKINFNPFKDFIQNWKLIENNKVLRRSLIAVSYFWFLGAVLILNTIVYVHDMLQLSEKMSGVLLFLNGIGIGLGSFIAGKLSKEKVEIGLIPIGAILMTFFTFDLYFSHSFFPRVAIDCILLGFGSGIFVIPLNTLIQARSPKEAKGRILATASFLSFTAISLASPFFWFFGTYLKANPAEVFLALGSLSLIATIFICVVIPQSLVRLVLYVLTNTVYRINVIGRENVPLNGPALLVSNHVSLADPFLVSASLSRAIRFIMYRGLFEKPLIKPFVRLMEAIPISPDDNPKEIMKSLLKARKKLQEGHLVCVFAEGGISRQGGTLLGFKRGIEVIMKGMDAPVVPVHLEGVWGSIFSFKNKKFIWKWPKRIPYPVTISFGKQMKTSDSSEVRQAVLDLGAEAFFIHRKKEPTLFSSFLTQAKSNLRQEIISDSTNQKLTYHRLLTGVVLTGKTLNPLLGKDKNAGILIPPSAGGALINLSLVSKGFIPINLNYTLSKSSVDAICKKAKITKIITSKKVLSKLGWDEESNFIFIEDLLKKISPTKKIWIGLLTSILPKWLLMKLFFNNSPSSLDDLATIMFTSGSTGIPKGVMLTEANILSNIQSLTMILQFSPTDTLLGILPFFHSFGFTASLWFPLISGSKVVYHSNPLDTKVIGKLCRQEKVTFLMGTPTFFSTYVRRIDKENFGTLRFAMAGAEKLRTALATAFEEKFGVPIMEGYGCTELSPVVALNLPDIVHGEIFQVGRKVGKIGRPIPGVSVKVVDPETEQQKKQGESGLLLVKGPNVMKGYLDDPEKTAEVLRGGWYVTGDIATIDEDGFIEITDRLSRFSKIGGEMVPHIMVEQKLQELAKSIDRQFVVSSTPDGKKGEALVVLVSGFKGDINQLWKELNDAGLPKIWIPSRDKFYLVDSFPTLGSGKLDMQGIKRMVDDKIMSQ